MNNREPMHPQDIRNLILFSLCAIGIWLYYDFSVARPQAEARRVHAEQRQSYENSIPAEARAAAAEKPRHDIIALSDRIRIETPTYMGSINLKGARLDDLRLKDYYKTVERKEHEEILSPARSPFPRYVETGWVAAEPTTTLTDANTIWQVKGGNTILAPDSPVTLMARAGGLIFEKTFTVDDEYGFSVENRVTNETGATLTLYPFALVTEHGLPEDFQNLSVVHEGPIAYLGETLEERSYKGVRKNATESFSASTGWTGMTGKYWLTAVANGDQTEETRYRFTFSPASGLNVKDRYQTDMTGSAREIAAGASGEFKTNVFSGPKRLSLLENYETQWNLPHFDLAVDFGWFYFLTKPFFLALNFLYGLVGNFGIAIIIFTCFLRLLIFPLANTSYRSFAALRKVSPEMYEIRQKYKDDKAKLQQELVALYQRHNVNPMAGCLPILVQIPIFFSLYKVLSNTIEMRHAPFYGWIHDLSAMDPTTVFNLFGLIPWNPPSFLMIGAWPILMLIGLIIQRNISPPPEDPIQKRLIQVMPWFMTFIMAKFASGLVIYWTLNNLLAIIQQVVIMKSMGVPIHLFNKDGVQEKLEKEIEEGPVVHPGLELAEHKIEEALHLDGPSTPVTPPKPKKKKKK